MNSKLIAFSLPGYFTDQIQASQVMLEELGVGFRVYGLGARALGYTGIAEAH